MTTANDNAFRCEAVIAHESWCAPTPAMAGVHGTQLRSRLLLAPLVLAAVRAEERGPCAAWCGKWTCNDAGCLGCGLSSGCQGRDPSPPPFPAPPPWPPDTKRRHKAEYWTAHNRLYTNAWGREHGAVLNIKGAVWPGMADEDCHLRGVDIHPVGWYVQFLKDYGFNAIRLPIAASAITTERHPCVNAIRRDSGAREQNNDLIWADYLEQVAQIVRAAGNLGVLVLLDMRLQPGKPPDLPVPGHLAQEDRETLKTAWVRIAQRMCDADEFWNLLGADVLDTLPHMWWGEEGSDEPLRYPAPAWNTLASEQGDKLLRACPRWLVFVQGVGRCTDGSPEITGFCTTATPGSAVFEVVSWQGENLQGAAMFPVALPADKVVYSPLIGLPSTQPYERTYTDPAFPHNMREVWDDNWGYLMREGRAAVVVGQFGGSTFEGADRAYQVELVGYLRQISAGGFYFALEQDGLLLNIHELRPHPDKIQMLASIPSTHIPDRSILEISPPPPPRGPPPPPFVLHLPPPPPPRHHEIEPAPAPPSPELPPPPPEPPSPPPLKVVCSVVEGLRRCVASGTRSGAPHKTAAADATENADATDQHATDNPAQSAVGPRDTLADVTEPSASPPSGEDRVLPSRLPSVRVKPSAPPPPPESIKVTLVHAANRHADWWPTFAVGLVAVVMLCYCCARRWQEAYLRSEVVSAAADLDFESHQADARERRRRRKQLALARQYDDEDDYDADDAGGGANGQADTLQLDYNGTDYVKGDFRLVD